MIRADDVGETGRFKRADVLAAGHFRDQEKHAHAAAFFGRDAGKHPQGNESGAFRRGEGDVCYYQRPFASLQLG